MYTLKLESKNGFDHGLHIAVCCNSLFRVMLSPRRKDLFIPAATVFVDAVAIELAFLLSYWLRFHSPLTEFIPVTKGFPPLIAYVRGSLFVIPVWLWLFS